MMMVEARREERVRSLLRARIIYNGGNSTLDCVVRNLSTTGAKLEFSSPVPVPAEFDLDIPQRGRVYRARIMWRDAGSAGVSFVIDAAQPNDETSEVERLRRENKKLKAMVSDLSRRLDDLGFSPNSAD